LATDVGTLKGKIEADEKILKTLRLILIPAGKQNGFNLVEFADISETGEFEIKVAPREYFLVVKPSSFLRKNSKLPHLEWINLMTKDAEKVTVKPNETTTITIKK
jgi:hypothetical protein